MAPAEGRVMKPERWWGCRRSTPAVELPTWTQEELAFSWTFCEHLTWHRQVYTGDRGTALEHCEQCADVSTAECGLAVKFHMNHRRKLSAGGCAGRGSVAHRLSLPDDYTDHMSMFRCQLCTQ